MRLIFCPSSYVPVLLLYLLPLGLVALRLWELWLDDKDNGDTNPLINA